MSSVSCYVLIGLPATRRLTTETVNVDRRHTDLSNADWLEIILDRALSTNDSKSCSEDEVDGNLIRASTTPQLSPALWLEASSKSHLPSSSSSTYRPTREVQRALETVSER
jgi:hypothetical protein